jgi:hypothetical protein
MNGCTETQFELQKIKILKGASGVEIDFNVKRNTGDGETTDRYSKETTTFPHPDLIAAVDSLKDILIVAVGKETIHSERIIAGFKGKFKKAEEYAELEKVIEDHMKGEKAKIVITGISVSGYDSNKGAIITATYTCKNGSKIAVNSPRIRFEGESYGFEEAFQEICEVIQREAYLYTFQDKQAQQSIVFEEGKTE